MPALTQSTIEYVDGTIEQFDAGVHEIHTSPDEHWLLVYKDDCVVLSIPREQIKLIRNR